MKFIPHLKSLRAVLLLSTRANPMGYELVDDTDREVLRRRIDSEGLHFPCVVLPQLGKALERCLETGVWSTPPGFSNQKDNGRPLLLQRAFNILINEKCELRANVDVKLAAAAVLTIRQVTLVLGKCDLGTMDSAHVTTAWEAFKANQYRLKYEGDVRRQHVWESTRTGEPVPRDLFYIADGKIPISNVIRRARLYIAKALETFDISNVQPCHGAGASENRVTPPRRYSVLAHVYNEELDRVMPYSDYVFAGGSHLATKLEHLDTLEVVEEFHDRANFVPKDCTKVRGISVVHSTPMYFGQAVARALTASMNDSPFRHEFDIRDQNRNKALAREASKDKSLTTVDLQDASDSLRKELVYLLFPDHVARYLHAVRSSHTTFRGEKIEYQCWAPMGHPTCFPVQTLVFWALSKAVAYITTKTAKVSVYGDDIILPTAAYPLLCDLFLKLGLKVNLGKSFTAGFFRESCGGDYYHGFDVSIVRCKKPPIPRQVPGVKYADCTLRYTDFYGRLITRYGISVYDPAYESILRICNAQCMGPVLTVPCDSPEDISRIAGMNALPIDLLPKGWFVPSYRHRGYQTRMIRGLSVKPVTYQLARRGERADPSQGPVYRVDSGWSLLLRAFCLATDGPEGYDTGSLHPAGEVRTLLPHTGNSQYAPRGGNTVARVDVPFGG